MIQSEKELFEELNEIFKPKVIAKLESHLASLWQKIDDLEYSRNNWHEKYLKLKKEIKK